MEIDFIQRFGFGRVPDSAFQDILVDACAVTKAGVGMAGGVGRIGGKLPGKLRFALTIFVVRIRLDADFFQERIEFAVTPVLFVPETAFSIGKERTVFHRGGIRMFKNRDAKVENGNDAVASGFGLATADQISTGYLSSYINENEIEFESGISEDTLLELKKIKRRPEMIRALSEYIIGMLDQPETMEAPITLFELDKMIPKKVDGDYLNYMKLLFIERNQPVIGWSPDKN